MIRKISQKIFEDKNIIENWIEFKSGTLPIIILSSNIF